MKQIAEVIEVGRDNGHVNCLIMLILYYPITVSLLYFILCFSVKWKQSPLNWHSSKHLDTPPGSTRGDLFSLSLPRLNPLTNLIELMQPKLPLLQTQCHCLIWCSLNKMLALVLYHNLHFLCSRAKLNWSCFYSVHNNNREKKINQTIKWVKSH